MVDISNGIKPLTRELNVPIVVPSQLNRGPGRETNRKPRRLSVRGSGSIEQDDALMGLLYKSNADDEKDGPALPEEDALPVGSLGVRRRNGLAGGVQSKSLKTRTRLQSACSTWTATTCLTENLNFGSQSE